MSASTKLIPKYIDTSAGRAEARVVPYGVSVWALVGYLKAAQGDKDRVARDYEVPREAVEAAEAYYRRNKALIDARLAMNEE